MLESGMYHDSNPKGLFHTSHSKGINDQYMCPGGSMAQLNACGGGKRSWEGVQWYQNTGQVPFISYFRNDSAIYRKHKKDKSFFN